MNQGRVLYAKKNTHKIFNLEEIAVKASVRAMKRRAF